MLSIAALAALSLPVPAATGPAVDQTQLYLSTHRQTAYSTKPGERDTGVWRWTPRVDVRLNGPVHSKAMLYADFALPDHRSWYSVALQARQRGTNPGSYWTNRGIDLPEELGSVAAGRFDCRIRMVNRQTKEQRTLFTGKVHVKKVHLAPHLGKQDDYYVDQDWRLPVGEVYGDYFDQSFGRTTLDDRAPFLIVALWYRGAQANDETVARLFYRGREIANTRDIAKGTNNEEWRAELPDPSPYSWSKVRHLFFNVRLFNHIPGRRPSTHDLDKFPGEYQVKVWRKGKLVRSATFTVKNGRVVDGGLGRQIHSDRWVIPVTVTSPHDGGNLDLDAWKTGAFYGNPLMGFAVP